MRAVADTIFLALARLGPAGLSPKAPGTVGSAVAALAAPWLFAPLSLPWRVAVLAVLFVIGGLSATRAERVLGCRDPSSVVVDELVGQWITLLPLGLISVPGPAAGPAEAPLCLLAAGFCLFRLFDIWKPGPIYASQEWLPAGWGVMIDDVLAGVFAAPLLAGLAFVFAAAA
ncbi:MAG: phosphatidylglycerophosphatase A [Desulfovibrionaceae bacterium]|nr:phosphatidylglycerophosphatase A [Desulfovibrionaceae bacterium]